jgi:hypothetical protein
VESEVIKMVYDFLLYIIKGKSLLPLILNIMFLRSAYKKARKETYATVG